MRSCFSRVFNKLGPDILHRIELGSCHGEVKHMQTFLLRHKLLNQPALMHRMTVNDQNQRSGDDPQELLDKSDHLFSSQRMPVGLHTEPEPLVLRRNQQGTQQIEALVVRNTGPLDRGLAPAGPGTLQRRDQREAAFICQTEGSAQLATLFLSLAVLRLSSAPPPHPPVAEESVGVAGCSSPSAALRAKRHSGCNGLQITARSLAPSDPASSNFRPIRRHRPLGPMPSPAVSSVSPTASWADPADPSPFSWYVWLLVPIDKPSPEPHPKSQPLPAAFSLDRVTPARAAGLPSTVHLFLFVSSPYYHAICNFHFSKINSLVILALVGDLERIDCTEL